MIMDHNPYISFFNQREVSFYGAPTSIPVEGFFSALKNTWHCNELGVYLHSRYRILQRGTPIISKQSLYIRRVH